MSTCHINQRLIVWHYNLQQLKKRHEGKHSLCNFRNRSIYQTPVGTKKHKLEMLTSCYPADWTSANSAGKCRIKRVTSSGMHQWLPGALLKTPSSAANELYVLVTHSEWISLGISRGICVVPTQMIVSLEQEHPEGHLKYLLTSATPQIHRRANPATSHCLVHAILEHQ